MNLQITVPYQTCPYGCPFCIANNPDVQGAFNDLYTKDQDKYFELLGSAILSYNIKTVVLTGDTEPTLNMGWVKRVSEFIKVKYPTVKVELQTKKLVGWDHHLPIFHNIDVVAFSVDNATQYSRVNDIGKIIQQRTNTLVRCVVILTSRFVVKDALYGPPLGFSQITYKVIQKGANEKVNKWIDEHPFVKWNDLDSHKFVMDTFGVSVLTDKNCMDSENRYLIFREDGLVYKTWAELPKEEKWDE